MVHIKFMRFRTQKNGDHGEERQHALSRELREELGITVRSAVPFERFVHDYPDKRVSLDIWLVDAWQGTPSGCAGQTVDWFSLDAAAELPMPAADIPVFRALRAFEARR